MAERNGLLNRPRAILYKFEPCILRQNISTMLLCIVVSIFPYYTKNHKQKHRIKGEYQEYNRIIKKEGVVLSKDNTALFSSTKKYSFLCDFAFLLKKEQNSNFTRAPPLILKSNHFKMNGGLIIVNLFY